MSIFSVFAWALFGGAFSELLHWGGLRRRSKYFPIYAGTKRYWVITLLMIIAGAVLAVAISLSGTGLTPLTAILFGYSAPSIIQKLAKNVPTPKLGHEEPGSEPSPSVLGFLMG